MDASPPHRHGGSAADRSRDFWIAAGFWAAALILYTVGLGGGGLRDWDEGIYAQVAREISRSSSAQVWLHPTLQGGPFLHKPPLLLWLIAIAYGLGGVNEWTARLPGAFLSAGSVPLLYGVGREVFTSRPAAVWSAFVYLTLFPVVRHGRLAMLDGAAIFFFLVLVFCLLRARRDPRWALGIGLGLGLIGLTKGMLALLLGGVALIFLVLEAPRLLRSPHLWIGLFLGMLPVGLWYATQWQASGRWFWSITVVDQSFRRIWAPVEGHAGPPWYYLWEILKSAWPWVLFWPWGLRPAWEHRQTTWGRLILIWTMGYGLPISVMATKLPWYVLPLYPALALAVGVALSEAWQRGSGPIDPRSRSTPYPPAWSVVLGLSAAAWWAGWVYTARVGAEQIRPLQWSVLAAALTFTAAAILLRRHDSRFIWALSAGSYLVLVLYVVSPLWAWDAADDYPVKPVAAMIQQHTVRGQVIYTSHPYSRPSLDFYADRFVVPKPLEELRQQWQQGAAPYLLVNRPALERFNPPDGTFLGEAQGWYLLTRRR